MRRIVSVVCPSFALWAQPHPNDAAQAQPWALTVERRNLVIVHDANPVARAAGAQPGQPLTDARALVPGLRSVSVDPVRIERAWQTTAHWLTRYTPLVALDPASPPTDVGGAAGFVLDVSGCSHLFGGEQGLLRDLVERMHAWGLPVRAAMADTPLAAWGLARCGDAPVQCVPAGETLPALRPLPVTALNLPDATVEALDRLGLRRIGDIVALDRQALGQRFSEKLTRKQAEQARTTSERLLEALDRALGKRPDAITPLLPAASYAARKLFHEPIGTAASIEQTLVDLMAAVLPMVRRAGQGVRQATVSLYRVDGARQDIRLRFHRPTLEPGLLLRLFSEQTETLDVGFGLDAVGLSVQRAETMQESQDSLLSHSVPGRHHPVLDRLTNRLGAEAVAQPTLRPRHDPREAELRQSVENAFATPLTAVVGVSQQRSAAALDQDLGDPEIAAQAGLRRQAQPRPVILLAEPQPVQIDDAQPLTSGLRPPHQFHWRRQHHRLVRWSGPERLTPAWWDCPNGHLGTYASSLRSLPVTKDYFHVEDEEGRQFWMARTCSSPTAPFGDRTGQAAGRPRWTVEGLFA